MDQQKPTAASSQPQQEVVGTKVDWRALAIAASAGFALELILAFASFAATRGTQGGMFGPSQQDLALGVFSGLVLGIFGLLASASIGGFYAWLSRHSSVLPKAIMLGGALAAILPALAAKALGLIAGLASLANQTQATIVTAFIAGLVLTVISVAIGGAVGAVGARLTCRLILVKHA